MDLYSQTGEAVAYLADDRESVYLYDGAPVAYIDEEAVYAYRFSGKRYDCGSKLGYLQATVEYGYPDAGLSIAEVDYQPAGGQPTPVFTPATGLLLVGTLAYGFLLERAEWTNRLSQSVSGRMTRRSLLMAGVGSLLTGLSVGVDRRPSGPRRIHRSADPAR